MAIRAVRVVVRGWVQGVGFRYSTLRQATDLGLAGWVRNRGDGSVEAWLEGPAADVQKMLEWLAEGPGFAHVAGVSRHDELPAGLTGFRVTADA